MLSRFLVTISLAFGVGFGLGAGLVTPAQAECYESLDEAGNALARYGQVPKGMGIQDSDQRGESPLVLFFDPSNRHWSILQLMPGRGYCVAAVGRDWRVPPVGMRS